MGARRTGSPATATSAAAVVSAKKKKSSHAASPSHGSSNGTAAVASPSLAATQAADVLGKREGKKKRAKQDSCSAKLPEALPSCPASICSDEGSTSKVCVVLPGGSKTEQRRSVCEQVDDNHIISAVAAHARTATAAASEEVAVERQNKRRKRDSSAEVEEWEVTSTSVDTGSSSSDSAFSRSSSVCSERIVSSGSSSTCCSSPSASLKTPQSVSTAKDEKRKGGAKEGKEHAERCIPGISAAAAAESSLQQGNLLSTYKLTPQTLAVLQQRGIQQLLPIQAATFSSVYSGKDLIGRADTGTGKTLAFALPLVERLLSSPSSNSNSSDSGKRSERRGVRLLVLLPTRELAQQVHAEVVLLLQGRLETACVYGGGGAAAAGRQQQQPRWQNSKSSQQGGQLQQQQQLENLRRGRCAVLVGCPGRVKDLINRGYLQRGDALQSVVLDEADRLLDMGFREDVEEILQWCRDAWKQANLTPIASDTAAEKDMKNKGELSTEVPVARESHDNTNNNSKEALQFLLFTATLPHWAKSLASRFMRPDRLVVDAETLSKCSKTSSTSTKTDEKIVGSSEHPQQQSGTAKGITYMVLFCPWKNRVRVLEDVLTVYAGSTSSRPLTSTLASAEVSSIGVSCSAAVAAGDGNDVSNGGRRAGAAAVIFAETKQQVNEIALESGLRRLAAPLHGDLPQQQRETTLHAFKSGCFPYLVATDVAARGLHVDGLPLVVQLSPPRDLDSFVHRAGRTGRAGKAGICLTFAAAPDIPMLLTLEKKLRMQFKRVGVPQPAGIQRRLLDLQLRWILPPTAASSNNGNTASLPSCSSADDSGMGTTEKVRKQVRHADCKDAGNSAETMEKTSLVEFREECDDRKEEEMRQIFDAADRVLHALSPREAVRRCLALILRHAAAGTASGTAFPRSDSSTSGISISSGSAASEAGKGTQTTNSAGQERLSCLNGREGHCTYILRKREQQRNLKEDMHPQNSDDLLRTPGEVWRLLKGALLYQKRRIFSGGRGSGDRSSVSDQRLEELLERIRSLTLTADGRGAVFDVAAEDIPAFEAHVLRRCREQDSTQEEACRESSIGVARKRKRDRNSAPEVEEGRRGKDMNENNDDNAGDVTTNATEIPFTIREVEELPELVDALALRRSEQTQGGSRNNVQQGRYSDFRSPWKNGSRESNDKNRGGGYNHYNNGNNSRTWGSSGTRFRSENSCSSSSTSDRGMQQRSESWSSRGRGGGSRGRGGGGRGGSVGVNRGRRGFESNRGRGGYHHGEC